ncbi:hypothetical protein K110096F8_29850 [Dielma fastidiosa]
MIFNFSLQRNYKKLNLGLTFLKAHTIIDDVKRIVTLRGITLGQTGICLFYVSALKSFLLFIRR